MRRAAALKRLLRCVATCRVGGWGVMAVVARIPSGVMATADEYHMCIADRTRVAAGRSVQVLNRGDANSLSLCMQLTSRDRDQLNSAWYETPPDEHRHIATEIRAHRH